MAIKLGYKELRYNSNLIAKIANLFGTPQLFHVQNTVKLGYNKNSGPTKFVSYNQVDFCS